MALRVIRGGGAGGRFFFRRDHFSDRNLRFEAGTVMASVLASYHRALHHCALGAAVPIARQRWSLWGSTPNSGQVVATTVALIITSTMAPYP